VRSAIQLLSESLQNVHLLLLSHRQLRTRQLKPHQHASIDFFRLFDSIVITLNLLTDIDLLSNFPILIFFLLIDYQKLWGRRGW